LPILQVEPTNVSLQRLTLSQWLRLLLAMLTI